LKVAAAVGAKRGSGRAVLEVVGLLEYVRWWQGCFGSGGAVLEVAGLFGECGGGGGNA